jgi:hypothetical protein
MNMLPPAVEPAERTPAPGRVVAEIQTSPCRQSLVLCGCGELVNLIASALPGAFGQGVCPTCGRLVVLCPDRSGR